MIFLEKRNPDGHFSRMAVFIIVAFAAYLLGSFPSGYLAGRCCGKDLRKEGSGNIGATNAFRVLGKKWGYTVFLIDTLKGAGAVTLGFHIADWGGFEGQMVIIAGIVGGVFVILGHNYPVWLKFQGGKGIATSAGVAIALFPVWLFVFGILSWTILFFTTRYVSIASLAAAVSLPTTAFVLVALGQCDLLRAFIALAMCVLAIFRHKPNIERLLAGTEKRFERRPRNAA